MAADPKKPNKDKNEKEANEENQNADAASGQKKKKLFMMIGIAVLLMGLSIGGTLLAVKMMSSDKKSDSVAEESESEEESEEGEEETPAAPAIYYTMQPNFTVNFNVDGRQRYLQAELTLLYRNPEVEALLTLHMPAIRNQLVMLLSGKSFDELQNPDSREKLKVESMAAIQSILDKENAALHQKEESDEEEDEDEEEIEKKPPLVIEQVLFTKFVMQ